MSLPTIPEGLTVKYQHRRNWTRPVTMAYVFELDPRGGETVASVFDADGNLVASGVACCHAKDNYSKRIGRAISLGRALKQLETGPLDTAAKRDALSAMRAEDGR